MGIWKSAFYGKGITENSYEYHPEPLTGREPVTILCDIPIRIEKSKVIAQSSRLETAKTKCASLLTCHDPADWNVSMNILKNYKIQGAWHGNFKKYSSRRHQQLELFMSSCAILWPVNEYAPEIKGNNNYLLYLHDEFQVRKVNHLSQETISEGRCCPSLYWRKSNWQRLNLIYVNLQKSYGLFIRIFRNHIWLYDKTN